MKVENCFGENSLTPISILFWITLLIIIGYIVGIQNFLLFHSLAEGFTILISISISIIALNTYKAMKNSLIPIIGIAYAFSSIFDIVHALSYTGMGIFPDNANMATQMWIISRYLESGSMLIAVLSFDKSIKISYILTTYSVVSVLLLLAVFQWHVFPVTFIDGQGLTFFKVYSEYIICLLFITSMILLLRCKNRFSKQIYQPLLIFFMGSICTELSLTLYKSGGGWENVVGHLLKVISFIFLYRAIVETSLKEPYNRMYTKARLLDLAYDYIIVTDMNDRVQFWNQRAETGLGWQASEAHGQLLCSLLQTQFPESETCTRDNLLTQGYWEGELIHTKKNGEKLIVKSHWTLNRDTANNPMSILKINHDITDKKRFEAEFDRLDILNIVGEMAAGIGHEVRNPMTTVRGYLQLFQHKDKFTEYHPQLTTMIEELDRANTVITEFLSLAKNKAVDMAYGNLNDIIKTIQPLLQANAFQLGHELRVKTSPIPDIELDEKAMRQLILNLVINGLEAMQQKGVVTIQTYLKSNQIILCIEDTGTGIPAKVMKKLGTPFLTTKEKGTGLGLPVCYRIAQRHNAKINVSTSNQGTLFSVCFPT